MSEENQVKFIENLNKENSKAVQQFSILSGELNVQRLNVSLNTFIKAKQKNLQIYLPVAVGLLILAIFSKIIFVIVIASVIAGGLLESLSYQIGNIQNLKNHIDVIEAALSLLKEKYNKNDTNP
jgi:hypothetical protein